MNYFNSKKTQVIKKQEPIENVPELFSELEISEITDNQLLITELRKKIHDTIAGLPPTCRKIFKLSRNYNYKYSQIADKMNVSVSTVEKQISTALKKLRAELKDYLPIIFLILSSFL